MTRDGSHRPIRPATPGAGRTTDRVGWLLGVTAAVLVALATTVVGGAWTPARHTGSGYVMVLYPHDGTAVEPAVRILRDRLRAAGYPAAPGGGLGEPVPRPGREGAASHGRRAA